MPADARQTQTLCWHCRTVQDMAKVCRLCGVYVPNRPVAELDLVDCPGCRRPKPAECRCPDPQCDHPPDA